MAQGLATSYLLVTALVILATSRLADGVLRIDRIDPPAGSLAGGTRLIIEGEGFSGDAYAAQNTVLVGKYECHVIAYYTTSTQIVCETSEAQYEGKMTVSVTTVGAGTTSTCCFSYQGYSTPELSLVRPAAAPPGSEVKLLGPHHRYFKYDSTDLLATVGPVFFGDYMCAVEDQGGDEAFYKFRGLLHYEMYALHCGLPQLRNGSDGPYEPHLAVAGSHNVTLHFEQSPYKGGVAASNPRTYMQDRSGRKYQFQVVPVVRSVAPRSGSLVGGTVLRIQGEGFPTMTPSAAEKPGPDGNHKPVTLWAAGVPCTVMESSYNTLLCRTGPAPLQYDSSAGAVRGLYPGSRGVKFELFNSSSGWSHIGDIPGLDASNYVKGVNYSQTVLLDKFEVVWDQQTAAFATRSKAFFIPPMDGNYTFEVAPDDDGRLDVTYLNTTTGAEIRVAAAAGITNGYTTYQRFDRYSSQKSAAMLLKQGQPVLLEMSHLQLRGQAHFSVGVRLPPVAGGAPSWNSRAERQTIRVSADYYGPQKTISLRWKPTGQQTWLFTVTSSSASDLTDSSLALSLAWSTPATVVPVTSSSAVAVAKVAAGLSVDSKSVGWVVDNTTANTIKWYITVPSEALPNDIEDVGRLVNATTGASASGSATMTETGQGNAGAKEPVAWDQWYLVDPDAGQGDVLDYNATSSDVRSHIHSITGSWLSVDRRFVRDGATVGYDWVVSHGNEMITWPESHRFGVFLDESEAIITLTVTDTRNASVRLAGDFEVMALDGSSDNVTVRFDDSAATVQRKLRSLAGFGDGVRVYQSGGDKSRGKTYSVIFDPYTNPGNVGDIRIGNSTLVGTNVAVKAWTDTQGSLERFLRPIPADFLRLPVPVPQMIQLDANGVPYTCEGDGWACSFNYTTDATPTVTAVSTSNSNSSVVSQGDTLTITGTDLVPDAGSRRLLSTSVATDTAVTIGGASCAVVSSSATEIQCTMGSGGKGGTRHVLVEVPGKGFASSDASTRALPTMVLDALTVHTISPSTVSAVGATIVEINGTGFDADNCINNRVKFGSSDGVVVSCSSTVLRVMYIGQSYSTLGSNSATTVTPSVALYDADGSFLESESASTTVSVTESSVPYISVTSSGKLPPQTQVTATVSSQITDSTVSEVFFRLNPHSQPSAVQMTAPPSPPSYGSPGYGGYYTAAPTSSRRLLTVASTDLLAASYNSPQITCANASVSSSVLTCKAPRLPPGGYQMYVKLGDGVMVASTEILSIAMEIYSISPNTGSIGGNTTVTITGYGFSTVPGETVVVIPVPISTTFKNKVALCDVQTSTLYRVTCRTRAHLSADATATDPEATKVTAHSTKPAEVQVVWCGTNDTTKDILRVTCWSKSLYPHSRCAASDATACQFAYRWDDTPELHKVDTPWVAAGETLSITGLKLSDVTVHLKNDEAWLVCPSSFRSFTNINCTVPSSAPPGRYAIKLVQSDWQLGIGSGFVGVQTVISDVVPLAASLGGGVNMTVTAAAPGFDANLTRNAVSIQGVPCEVLAVDGTTLTCDLGAAVGRVKVEYYALESSSYFMPDFNTMVPRLVTYKDRLSDYWSSGKGPLAGVSDFFAVRVTGSLYIPLLGSYTFNLEGDDQANAYLDTDGDGQFEELVSSRGDSIATKTLSPGHVPLLLQMMEGTGAARYKLRWSTPSSSETVDIPKENLFAAVPGVENAVAISVNGVLAKHNCQYTSGASVSVPPDADTSTVAARGEATSLTMSGTGACGFFYSSMFTPRVSSVSPTTIGSSQTIRLEGTRFGSTAADLTVTVGGELCTGLTLDSSASPAVVTCTVPALPYGSHPLVLHRAGYGNDGSLLTLTYTLSITSLSPTSGSTAGGTWVAISGWGFAPRTAAQASDAEGEYVPWSRVYVPTLEAGGNSTPAVHNATSKKITLRMPASPSGDALSYVEVWVMGGDSGSSKLASVSSSSISQMYQWSSSATPSVTAFSSSTTPITANTALSLQLSWTVSQALTAGSSSKVSAVWLRANGTDVQYNCTIDSFTATTAASSYSETVTCTSDDSMAAGTYVPVLDVTGLGYSTVSAGLSITVPLTATAISPATGSLGGGLNVTLTGSGFPNGDIDGAFVLLGSSPCTVVSSSGTSLVCNTGNASSAAAATVTIGLKTLPEGKEFSALTFTYSSALTAEVTGVSPSRGSTAGGTALTITGTKLNLDSNPTVTLGTAECTGVTVSSATQISCTTSEPPNGISGGGEQVVEVNYPSYGNALSSASYEYINLWSRNTTWGGGPLPVEGDSVVVPENITVVLDISPPKLHTIVLYGHLVFDTSDSSANLVLQAHHILVIGGSFSVGSKDTPFPGSAEIVMYGGPDSPELPGYGSKNIAVRAGDVVMHGKHKEPTWTRLDATANVGDQQIVLAGIVNWAVGDEIAIASSSFEASHVDTTTIAAMSTNATHSTLTLLDALNYTHLGVVLDKYQSRTGHTLDMRAEVGVLTRSVVFRGDDSSAAHMFGAHLLMHTPKHLRGPKKYSDLQVEQIEVKHAGQAFRLGRYPMHFHMHGYMNYTSYIRGCAIHHTFNRAITVHGTHQITLQDNVAFDNMGHTFFLEDGIETENIIQGNLGFLTRPSHALLNTDVTPATFWIVHPNNTFRGNVAAGSHGYGYWFRLLQHPDGPSRTDTVCPRWSRLGEFVDNMAHSNMFYGLRIFPEFYPYSNPCGSNKGTPIPARFRDFAAYKNGMKCVIATQFGLLQFENFTVADCGAGPKAHKVSGKEHGGAIEMTWNVDDRSLVSTSYSEMAGIRNALVISRTAEGQLGTAGSSWGGRAMRGVLTQSAPQGNSKHSALLLVDNVTFVDWTGGQFYAVETCAKCEPFQGGFYTFMSNTSFIQNDGGFPKLSSWVWGHQAIVKDLDGTLINSQTVDTSSNLDGAGPSGWSLGDAGQTFHSGITNDLLFGHPDECVKLGYGGGVVCNPGLSFRRVMLNGHQPNSILFRTLLVTEDATNRTSHVSFSKYNENGYQFTAAVQRNYWVHWDYPVRIDPDRFLLHKMGLMDQDRDWLQITSKHLQVKNHFKINGKKADFKDALPLPPNATHGSHFYNKTLEPNSWFWGAVQYNDTSHTIFLQGDRDGSLSMRHSMCSESGCSEVPDVIVDFREGILKWSDPATWTNNENRIPEDGQNVTIPRGWTVELDVNSSAINRLDLQGDLAFAPGLNLELKATYLLVRGNLQIGNESMPYVGQAAISLSGNRSTRDMAVSNDLNLGSKFLTILNGNLTLVGQNHGLRWTRLRKAASEGSTSVEVEGVADWPVGGRVLLASTSFNPSQVDVVNITAASVVSQDAVTGKNYSTLTVTPLTFSHSARILTYPGTAEVIDMRGEVGLLSSNIVIRSADGQFQRKDGVGEKFGARTLVYGNSTAHIRDAAFEYCAVGGLTRACLEFENVDGQGGRIAVHDSAVAHGMGLSINIHKSATGVTLRGNVMYESWDSSSVVVDGGKNALYQNLGVGTHRLMEGDSMFSKDLPATFEVHQSDNILEHNVAAGSDRIGFYVAGSSCSGLQYMRKNYAHSSLVGMLLTENSLGTTCTSVQQFQSWLNWDFGLLTLKGIGTNVKLRNVSTVDNKHVGILILRKGFMTEEAWVDVEGGVIAGLSDVAVCELCATKTDPGCHQKLSRVSYNQKAPFNESVGLVSSVFALKFTPGPEQKPWDGLMGYPLIHGITRIKGTTFANFSSSACGVGAYAFSNHPLAPDASHPIHVQSINTVSASNDGLVKFYPPDPEWRIPADCGEATFIRPDDKKTVVDLTCQGLKHSLVKDMDGSFTQTGQPQALLGEIGRGQGRHASGYEQSTPVIDGPCQPSGEGYYCLAGQQATTSGYKLQPQPAAGVFGDPQMFVLESRDVDSEERNFAPVKLIPQNSSEVDLLVPCMDHGWCFAYTCQKRLSTFWAVVSTGMTYDLNFTGTPARHFRLWLPYADAAAEVVFKMNYNEPLRRYSWTPEDRRIEPLSHVPIVGDGSPHGSYYWDQLATMLYIKVKGMRRVEIRTESVVQVSTTLAMTVDEFYDTQETFLDNMAAVLGIKRERFKIVSIVPGSAVVRYDISEDPAVMNAAVAERVFDTSLNLDPDTARAYASLSEEERRALFASEFGNVSSDGSGTPTAAPVPTVDPSALDLSLEEVLELLNDLSVEDLSRALNMTVLDLGATLVAPADLSTGAPTPPDGSGQPGTAAPTAPPRDDDGDDGLSMGEIIAIAIGAVVLVTIMAAAAVMYQRRLRARVNIEGQSGTRQNSDLEHAGPRELHSWQPGGAADATAAALPPADIASATAAAGEAPQDAEAADGPKPFGRSTLPPTGDEAGA